MKLMRIALLPFLVATMTFAPSALTPSDALAANANNASQTLSIGTGTFKVVPETTTNGTATGIQSFPAASGSAGFKFFYVNTGKINANAFSWTIAYVSGTSGINLLLQCPVDTTFSSSSLCSDSSTPTTMAITGTGPALLTGQWLPVYLEITRNRTTYSAASTVSSSQIRAGFTTNS